MLRQKLQRYTGHGLGHQINLGSTNRVSFPNHISTSVHFVMSRTPRGGLHPAPLAKDPPRLEPEGRGKSV
jgi:hypothetical protein